MRLPGRWFAICVLTLAPSNAQAGVRISEVMADPTGSEFRNEYVELINLGVVPVDLVAISDGASTDVLVFDKTSVLAPGKRCLIVDPDYAGGDRPYGNLLDVFQVTIGDGAIGSAGLDNVEPETLSLISAMGDTVSSVTYAVGMEGHSYERVVTGTLEGEETWAFSKWPGGTPGKRNSVSPKRYDMELRLEDPPDSVLASGAGSQVRLLMISSGSDRSDSVSVTVTWLGGDVDDSDRIDAAWGSGAGSVFCSTSGRKASGIRSIRDRGRRRRSDQRSRLLVDFFWRRTSLGCDQRSDADSSRRERVDRDPQPVGQAREFARLDALGCIRADG